MGASAFLASSGLARVLLDLRVLGVLRVLEGRPERPRAGPGAPGSGGLALSSPARLCSTGARRSSQPLWLALKAEKLPTASERVFQVGRGDGEEGRGRAGAGRRGRRGGEDLAL